MHFFFCLNKQYLWGTLQIKSDYCNVVCIFRLSKQRPLLANGFSTQLLFLRETSYELHGAGYHEISRAYISVSLIENAHLHKDVKEKKKLLLLYPACVVSQASIIQGKTHCSPCIAFLSFLCIPFLPHK